MQPCILKELLIYLTVSFCVQRWHLRDLWIFQKAELRWQHFHVYFALKLFQYSTWSNQRKDSPVAADLLLLLLGNHSTACHRNYNIKVFQSNWNGFGKIKWFGCDPSYISFFSARTLPRNHCNKKLHIMEYRDLHLLLISLSMLQTLRFA